MAGLSLKALLQLETKQFQQGIKKVQNQVKQFGNFIKSAFALGSVTAWGKQMINVSKDFEDAMARVKAISNASSKDFTKMRDEAKKLGETTRYTASEAAGALESLTRNGMSAQNATKALSSVLQLAQANAIGLAEAADIVTNVLNMFGLELDQSSRVNDVLSSTAGNAATNVSELYDALVNAAPAANVLGFSIEETSAAIGALAQKGVKGADAGTQLRMSLTKMADPKIIKKMQEMGIAIDDQTMSQEGLLKTVKKLKDANLSLSELVEIFSQKGAMGMQELISAYDEFERMVVVTNNSLGTTQRMFEEGVGTTRKEIDTLKSSYEGLLISVGDKTSGIVNGAVRLITNLINNFKTLGGSISNIASVVVPLLVRQITRLGGTAVGVFGKIKVAALGVKSALGGWVGILATVVTWVGTSLVGAWNKSHAAMKEATKGMAEASSEGERLKTSMHSLLDELQPDKDKTTLAGVVNQLIGLFPDFAEEIRKAADEAGKTGNWENFKQLLIDIADLQSNVLAKEANQQLKDAAGEAIGNSLKRGRKIKKTTVVDDTNLDNVRTRTDVYDSFSSVLNRAIEREFGSNAKSMKDAIYSAIGKMIAGSNGDRDALGKSVNTYLKAMGIDMSKEAFELPNGQKIYDRSDDLSTIFGGNATINGVDFLGLSKQDKELLDQVKKAEDNVKTIDKNVADLKDKINPEGPTTSVTTPTVIVPTTTKKDKDTTVKEDELTTTLNDYIKSRNELKNQFNAGVLTETEYKDNLKELNTSTWESITAFDNFRTKILELDQSLIDAAHNIESGYLIGKVIDAGTNAGNQKKALNDISVPTLGVRDSSNDYMYNGEELIKKILGDKQDLNETYIAELEKAIDDIKSGDFDLIKADSLAKLETLQGLLNKAKNDAKDLNTAINYAEIEEKISNINEELKNETIQTVSDLSSAFDRLMDALLAIGEVWDEDIKDSKMYEDFERFASLMNAIIQILEVYKTISETLSTLEELRGQKALANSAKIAAAAGEEIIAKEAVAAADTKLAVAGAASSQAGTPIIGPILAIAAIAAVLGAILSSTSKFAEGGIIGGNSTTGDKILARVNSGEGILTADGVKNLNTLYNNQGVLGGDVHFKIRGSDLVGVLNNYNSIRRG